MDSTAKTALLVTRVLLDPGVLRGNLAQLDHEDLVALQARLEEALLVLKDLLVETEEMESFQVS